MTDNRRTDNRRTEYFSDSPCAIGFRNKHFPIIQTFNWLDIITSYPPVPALVVYSAKNLNIIRGISWLVS